MKVALISRVTLFCLLSVPAAAIAQIKQSSPVFVVDASDSRNRMTVVSVKTFNEALHDGTVGEAPAIDRYMNACSYEAVKRITGEEDLKKRAAVAETRRALLQKLHDCVDCLEAHEELRYFTARGDMAVLIVLVPDRFPVDSIVPHFEESPRQSELVATAMALAKVIREQKTFDCRAFTYTLQRKRARLKASIPNVAAPPVESPAATPAGGVINTGIRPAAANGTLTTPEVITGPREHLFMSADMTFEKSQFKFGETPEADKDRIKNKAFFAALNFSVGDLLVDRDSALQRRSIFKEIVFKLQVALSEDPFEAWAVGIGLRGDRLKALLWNMDAVHPYVTFGKLPDTLDPDRKHWRWAFGLGYDPRGLSR